jgi:hypothetical protein
MNGFSAQERAAAAGVGFVRRASRTVPHAAPALTQDA